MSESTQTVDCRDGIKEKTGVKVVARAKEVLALAGFEVLGNWPAIVRTDDIGGAADECVYWVTFHNPKGGAVTVTSLGLNKGWTSAEGELEFSMPGECFDID